jgi:two-component system response regulator YesN
MQVNFMVFFNIFIPIITGLFFLLYFAYFIFSNPSKAASYRYFIAFLLSFGVFLMGRALQVSAGPYPLPLIVVNVRVFILCAVVSPVTVMTSSVFRRKGVRRRELLLICGCVALGVVYVVFNTLGTRGSYVLYGGESLTIYDNLTPSMRPPLYAREVTLAVQVVVGALLLLFSLDKLISRRRGGAR